MARRLPATRPPAPRIIRYVDPSTPAELAYPMNPAALAAKQRRDRIAYARWVQRQQEIAVKDKRNRAFWLGFGALLALVLLAVVAVAGWWLWAVLGLGALAIPVLIAGIAALGVGGHRCITVVQHIH